VSAFRDHAKSAATELAIDLREKNGPRIQFSSKDYFRRRMTIVLRSTTHVCAATKSREDRRPIRASIASGLIWCAQAGGLSARRHSCTFGMSTFDFKTLALR